MHAIKLNDPSACLCSIQAVLGHLHNGVSGQPMPFEHEQGASAISTILPFVCGGVPRLGVFFRGPRNKDFEYCGAPYLGKLPRRFGLAFMWHEELLELASLRMSVLPFLIPCISPYMSPVRSLDSSSFPGTCDHHALATLILSSLPCVCSTELGYES